MKSWFSLPPVLEYYYVSEHPDYKTVPPFLPGCTALEAAPMEFLYPKPKETVLLPKIFDNTASDVVFKLAHQKNTSEVFWYVDETYVGTTQNLHELLLPLEPGNYKLTATDSEGNQIQQNLSVKMASE